MLGRTIGQYTIVEKIGEGGMGEVYRATDSVLERDVALKFLPESMAQDETARRRFLREARSAAALSHPFICQIHEIGQDNGVDFIAMEYVSGQMLKERLQGGALPLRECLKIASQIADALDKAEQYGIVHRDLKPANVMITREGHVKIMDFGLAKKMDGQDDSFREVTQTKLTREGMIVGTVPYMSPEQLKGEAVDSRSDIFSLGIILYEMMTGVHPFLKTDALATATAILQEEPAPPGAYQSDISPVAQYVVRKMLAKEPALRYQSAREIRTDLTRLQDSRELELVVPPTGPERRDLSNILLWLMIPVAIVAALVGRFAPIGLKSPEPSQPTTRSEIHLPEPERLEHNYRRGIAISPDGRYLVVTAGHLRVTRDESEIPFNTRTSPILEPSGLLLQDLSTGKWEPLSTELSIASNPVFSPSSDAIAFFAYGIEDPRRLVRISLAGEEQVLCES